MLPLEEEEEGPRLLLVPISPSRFVLIEKKDESSSRAYCDETRRYFFRLSVGDRGHEETIGTSCRRRGHWWDVK